MYNKEKQLMVTIRCLVYNHEQFIRQCLEGFVMQKTNFRFEAIVHDDASTDGSASIILEYAEKYPEIIKPIIETENQYSKDDDSLNRIMNSHTHGKYVAICEGDDYWTDPYKLQKQVDFLESHFDYSLCFHNAIESYESENSKKDCLFIRNANSDRDYSGEEILNKWIIPTASVVFRSEIIRSELYAKVIKEKRFLVGDSVLFFTAANYGKLRYLNQVMSVYRRHVGGVTSFAQFKQVSAWLNHNKALKDVFGNKYEFINSFIFKSYREVIYENMKQGLYVSALCLSFKVFLCYPLYTYKYIVHHLLK